MPPTPIDPARNVGASAARMPQVGRTNRSDATVCENIVSDLICYLLHLTARSGGDPAVTLGRGWGHYQYEAREDAEPGAGMEIQESDATKPRRR
jgi:hypothetical protein